MRKEGYNFQRRAIIESVEPQVDGGRFPIKRVTGETVEVVADIFADGHDVISAMVLFRAGQSATWSEVPMEPITNDAWRGAFKVNEVGQWFYTVEAWIDVFKTWRRDLQKKRSAGLNVELELLDGAALVSETAGRARGGDAAGLKRFAKVLQQKGNVGVLAATEAAMSPELEALMANHTDRTHAKRCKREFRVVVDPPLARFGAWYEMFPRSCGAPGKHGTFRDVERQLPRIARMGFDVLYFPPIHPIGISFRKGKNDRSRAAEGEPGSPWGIGSEDGGHKTIHSELGTLKDFRRLMSKARAMGIEIALDIAFHCSPDHPYVREHPDWFRKHADGSIQYAENPPNKYQDIYPFDFETSDAPALWNELKSIFEFWVEQGVRVFRVDNPHTKSMRFWEWCLAELKGHHPDLIFLAEAFTRPKLMYRLAKLGFTQSYNYFPWRNTKEELVEYFTGLNQPPVREFFRANLWVNTHDILTEFLQKGGRNAFVIRLILAAMLGASYGVYGPAFELCESAPRDRGSEDYLDSEKYEMRQWDMDREGNLTELIAQLNAIRRENPALQSDRSLAFHSTDNPHLLAFSKTIESESMLVVVSLDPVHSQRGYVDLNLETLGLGNDPFQVHDLLAQARYLWSGRRNYVELSPTFVPAHVFRVRQRVCSEQGFDSFV